MSSAPRYNPHYTIADYEQWEGDWELWNGVAVSTSPSPTRWHQHALTQLLYQIEGALRGSGACHCWVVADVDWRVAIDTVVRPDLSIVCQQTDGDCINVPPTLITEVISPSTAEKDRDAKRRLYEAQGVNWYLIVDVDARAGDLLELRDGQYQPALAGRDGIEIGLHENCIITVDLTGLFAGIE